MIKFFRKIRQQLLAKNKVSSYVLYAVGEIVLVVIGILIALSINNWQQENQNKKLEKRYLEDLRVNLKRDSTILQGIYVEAINSSEAKNYITAHLRNRESNLDSLALSFGHQWNPYKIFSPSTSTIDEMKSNGDLKIIRDESIRKHIVDIYNTYELFLQDENLYRESTREIFIMAKAGLNNITDYSNEEIVVLLREPKLANTIHRNFANGRVNSVENVINECNQLLRILDEYSNELGIKSP
ncbi:DUF6090 family protein [Algoriphagus namhaensis]|uniref:DUF6090 family protein n=1 Tax=Algoriphagus namhaensis TaxID=915353 RepID=A0ABV8ATE7_9BACT